MRPLRTQAGFTCVGGRLPRSLTSTAACFDLCFGGKYVQGTIPSTISNLVTLNELNMSYNFGMAGFLPPEIGSMANLTVLHIYSAGIHGELCDIVLDAPVQGSCIACYARFGR